MPDIYTIRFLFIAVILSLFTSSQLMAQQLPQINYQGVARKIDGSPVMDQAITLRLTIRDGSANSTSVYSETRQLTTNKFGLFTVVIGSSGALSRSGTMAGIVWSTGNKFLQVEIDPQGGNSFTNMGTSQLQSVPYAIHAATASPEGKAEGDLSGSYPNPTVSKLQGSALSTVAPVNGQILKWNGTAWTPSDAASAIGTISGNLPITSTMQSGNATLSISKADAATDGYLSKTDWLNFNDKATTAYVDAAILTNSNALTAETTRATTAEASKENVANKSTDGTFASNSDLKYPTEKATKIYVDAAIASNAIPDASISTKGKIQLSGDLTGTSDLPVIGDGKITTAKILDANVTDAKIAAGISASKVGLGNVDNTADLLKPVSTATQTALDAKASNTDLALKAPLASPAFTGTVSGITATMVGLGNVDNTSDANKPVSTATQNALDAKASNADLALKAPLASPTFTGTVAGITATMVGLGNVDNTSDANKPLSTATQTALDAKASNSDVALKAPIASPTFTGTVAGITATMVGLGNVDNTSDANKPVSTAIQTALDAKASISDVALKAPLASPTFTGTVSGITATMIGLGNIDNTSDANKPLSTATQTALDAKASNSDVALKAPIASPTFTGTVSGITASMVALGNADNTSDANKPVSTATQTALDAQASNSDVALKAPLASPTFTGTVSGISKSMVGLANVDNTTDFLNPVSTATQAALDAKASNSDVALKAPLASPTFTGTVSGITATMVGLGNVDNTSDATKNAATVTLTNKTLTSPVINSPTGIVKADVGLSNVDNTSDASKPVSTATQTALDLKASNSDVALKAPLASPTFTGTVSGITATMVGLANVDNTSDATKNAATGTLTNKTLTSPVINSPTGIVKADVGLSNVDNTSDASKPVSTATQSALDAKAPLASPTFTGTVSGISKSMVGLANVDNTTDLLKPVSTATQTALDAKASNSDVALKAPLASPTFTGTVSGITASMVGLGNADNTSDANKPVSTATQTALDAKASNSDVALKAPLASPTFTGTVAGITKSMVGLGNVDNTTDAGKPVSTATQTALDLKASNSDVALKAPLASPTFTGTVSGITATMVGLGNIDNTSDVTKNAATVTLTNKTLTSPVINSPTGIVKADVGLSNVDNTSDAGKPVSTATQSALDAKASNSDVALKAPLASPTFTGTVSGISKSMVGLANVDNTTDLLKPVSTATQTALDLKANLASPTFTGITTVSGSLTGGNAEASTLAGFSANINTQTGTSYTLTTADNGKIITLSNAGAITLTVPTLYAGFNCMIVQTGAGQVTISASGVTINNRNSYTKTAGTNAIATLIALTGTSFISSGDMSN